MSQTLPRPFPDAETVSGDSVALERLEPLRHAPGLWQAIGADAELWRSVPPGPFADEGQFLKWLLDRSQRSDQVLYAIVSRGDGLPLGLYFLIAIDHAMGRLEMGLVLGPELTRRKAGTEAFLLLAGYVFDMLGYRRLEWRCNPENLASVRAAERFGFLREGVLRQNLWLKGRNWDTAVYSLIDGEWPARRARLERWLAPANFDAQGRQRVALSALPL